MSPAGLVSPPVRDQPGHMTDPSTVLQTVLDQAPGSIRDLAREAGVSHSLLVAVRDGDRRLTPRTRDRLVEALRTWAGRCEGLAEELEAAEGVTEPGGDDG